MPAKKRVPKGGPVAAPVIPSHTDPAAILQLLRDEEYFPINVKGPMGFYYCPNGHCIMLYYRYPVEHLNPKNRIISMRGAVMVYSTPKRGQKPKLTLLIGETARDHVNLFAAQHPEFHDSINNQL